MPVVLLFFLSPLLHKYPNPVLCLASKAMFSELCWLFFHFKEKDKHGTGMRPMSGKKQTNGFLSRRLWERWEKSELLWSGEVILCVLMSPDKLQESFVANVDSYFDAASPSCSREPLFCRKNVNCFLRYVTSTLKGHFDWPFEPLCRRLLLTVSPVQPKHSRSCCNVYRG